MSSIDSVAPRTAAQAPWLALDSASSTLLPEPGAPPFIASADALTQLLVALKGASDQSLEVSTQRIQGVRSDLKEQLDEFLEKVREAAERIREAKEDGGGFFGDVFDAIGSALGDILGTLIDAGVDLVKSPVELTKAVVTNFGDTQAMLAAIGNCSLDLVRNGSTAADVKGFTEGVVSFCGDLSEHLARFSVEAGAAMLSGKSPLDALRGDAQALWQSLEHNILDNRAFWAVTGAIAKGCALAAAAASGGAFLPVAVGLLVALEVDKQTGFIEKAVGAKAAPWVRFGLEVAAAGCLGLCAAGSQSGNLVKALQYGTSLVQAGGSVYSGYRIIQNAQQNAEQLEQQASMQESMNRMQQLSRLLSRLMDSLKSDSEDARTADESAVSLVKTASATEASLIVSA